MAQVIRMQGYKDWKDGLITTKELFKGKVFREPPHLRDKWDKIIARATGNWDRVKHHYLCACDKCAPTKEEKDRKLDLMNKANETLEHDILCCCDRCLDVATQELDHSLAPSDCEPE